MPEKPRAGRRSHIAAITRREELIYLLSRACELEHGLSCLYLFAAYSLKTDAREGGLTPAEAAMTRAWKRRIAAVSVEEMLHLAQVCSLLTAIGGAPHFTRRNFPVPASAFPIGIKLSLEPFSLETAERMVCYEMPEAGILAPERQAFYDALRKRMIEPQTRAPAPALTGLEPFDVDYSTVGELYHKIETAFDNIPEEELFIGPREAQANPRYLDFDGKLVPVFDRASAHAAIDMIVEQGEAPPAAHPDAHFWVFDSIRSDYAEAIKRAAAEGRDFAPVRPVLDNPMTRFYDEAADSALITDPLTHDVADLFNVAYDTMLMMLLRFFAHNEESEAELDHLARGTLRLMASALRPLGEALTKMPAGPGHPGKTAGPGFGYNRNIHLLPHRRSAWVFFGERLRDLATKATQLCSGKYALPAEVEEAAAVLQELSEGFAPGNGSANAVAQGALFRRIEAARQSRIKPQPNGPLLVSKVETLVGADGAAVKTRPEMALCRCGASARKPFCDGSHARIGFSSEPSPDHTPDGVVEYRSAEITVLFNRLQCAASENCSRTLPEVFREGDKPWIQPERTDAERIVDTIRRCPSGALRYVRHGRGGPRLHETPAIRATPNGPYYVEGGIALETDAWNEGAGRARYTLCRCGASKNKPFCDGSHWRIGFKDPPADS